MSHTEDAGTNPPPQICPHGAIGIFAGILLNFYRTILPCGGNPTVFWFGCFAGGLLLAVVIAYLTGSAYSFALEFAISVRCM